MTRQHDDRSKFAAMKDYRESGESFRVVAARHGIGPSTLIGWLYPERKNKRKSLHYGADELALTGGRWVNLRGVQRWEEFVPLDKRDLSERERRHEWEDAMFDDDEARDAHARYSAGDRDRMTIIGERVYSRRQKRAQTARKVAA